MMALARTIIIIALLCCVTGSLAQQSSNKQATGSADCKNTRAATVTESLIMTRRDLAKNEKQNLLIAPADIAPDDKGEFKVKSIPQGRYRFDVRPPVESWYVRSMTLPAARDKTIDVSSSGITFKQGEKVAGLTITLSEGAASLRGKVISSREGVSLPSRLRMHLIPAEPESVEDLLRYSQVNVQSDTTFTLTSIAPGKYLIVARPAIEDESGIEILRPAAWDADMRKKLRLDGKTMGAVIDLKSCQHTSDYLLRYAQPVAAKPAKNSL